MMHLETFTKFWNINLKESKLLSDEMMELDKKQSNLMC